MIFRPAALALLALLLAPGAASADPMLRPVVTVTGPVLHLGDLFTGTGAQAGEAVVPSPALGTRVTYGADWLAAVAREHDLDWTPGSPFDQSSIARASRTVGTDAIKAQLETTIAARQSTVDTVLKLDTPNIELQVPIEAPDTVAVEGLTIDPQSGRFSASIWAGSDPATAERRRVTGTLIQMIAVPVLSHAMAPGDTIAAADLSTLKLQRDRLATDVVTAAADVIGKTPRRPLRAGDPLRSGDITVPLLVHRGDLVSIVLQTPSLLLTAQGQALQDGTLGAAIRVQNTKSQRVIDAVVAAADAVTVTLPGFSAAAAAQTAVR